MDVEALTVIVAGVSAVLGGVGVWIRARAKIAESREDAERHRNEWEQDTISQLRQENAAFWADRERTLCERIESLQAMTSTQQKRIDALEAEITELRTDGRAKDERIEELTKRVQQLEVENARLTAQREARDEQIALLREQNANLQTMVAPLVTLAADVSTMVRAYTAPRTDATEQAA